MAISAASSAWPSSAAEIAIRASRGGNGSVLIRLPMAVMRPSASSASSSVSSSRAASMAAADVVIDVSAIEVAIFRRPLGAGSSANSCALRISADAITAERRRIISTQLNLKAGRDGFWKRQSKEWTPSQRTRPARAEQQRTRVHQTILKEQRVNRVTNVNFTINVGARVPRQMRLEVLPAAILSIVPHYRSYRWWAASASYCVK